MYRGFESLPDRLFLCWGERTMQNRRPAGSLGSKLFVLALLVASASCSSSTPQGWQESDLMGQRFVYQGDGYTEVFRFEERGVLLCTLAREGEIPIAPAFYWKIDSQGVLLISGYPDFRKPIKYELVEKKENTFKLLAGGESLTWVRD